MQPYRHLDACKQAFFLALHNCAQVEHLVIHQTLGRRTQDLATMASIHARRCSDTAREHAVEAMSAMGHPDIERIKRMAIDYGTRAQQAAERAESLVKSHARMIWLAGYEATEASKQPAHDVASNVVAMPPKGAAS